MGRADTLEQSRSVCISCWAPRVARFLIIASTVPAAGPQVSADWGRSWAAIAAATSRAFGIFRSYGRKCSRSAATEPRSARRRPKPQPTTPAPKKKRPRITRIAQISNPLMPCNPWLKISQSGAAATASRRRGNEREDSHQPPARRQRRCRGAVTGFRSSLVGKTALLRNGLEAIFADFQ